MQPTVSVIIPVRNEPDAIRAAIQSILDQTYPGITELIIADGMSTDETRLTIASFADSRIRVVDNVATSTPAALNCAIRVASGEIIVRCDAHSVLPPDYVALAVQIMSDTGAINVGGIQRATGTGFIDTSIALAMSNRLGVGDANFHYGGEAGPTDTVYLGVFDKEAVENVGLFDESLIRNQDYELNIRLRQAGGIVYFDPRLEVEYRPRSSLTSLASQYFQYGSWKRVVHRRHPDSIRLRQLAAPVLVLALAASGVLAFTSWWRLAVVIPFVYLLALATATIITAIKTRRLAALLMPAAIATMHLSWGFGYLSGSIPGKPAASE